MYTKVKPPKTSIKINNSFVGERIEQKVSRIVNNKEPIKDGVDLRYTERKEGVRPEYDIRTDRWEVAVDATDAVSKRQTAMREERHNPKTNTKSNDTKGETKTITGGESTQDTK